VGTPRSGGTQSHRGVFGLASHRIDAYLAPDPIGDGGRPRRLSAAAGPLPGAQAAVGVIVTVSFLVSVGSGIVTSTTPSCVLALIFFASTPAGNASEREKEP
jgi:hypothetical protein